MSSKPVTLQPLAPKLSGRNLPEAPKPTESVVFRSSVVLSTSPDLLQSLADSPIVPSAVPERKRGKSMSRRSGQSGNVVQQGNWYRVRFRLDIPGQDERKQMNVKICPASGVGKLTKPQIEKRAQEIVNSYGANSEEYFNKVVGSSVTFREQSKVWLEQATTRKRNPIDRGRTRWWSVSWPL
jgi:hypothetical protein